MSAENNNEAPQLSTDAVIKLAALDAMAQLEQSFGVETKWPEDQIIDGYKLVCTCGGCPEQYTVFDAKDQQVGYLRLRRGWFRADLFPSGTTVYEAEPRGDGVFDPEERMRYLTAAVAALRAAMGH